MRWSVRVKVSVRWFWGNRLGDTSMNCDLEQSSEGLFICRRTTCKRHKKPIGPTPHDVSRIHVDCRGWPRPWEAGFWIGLVLSAFGFTKGRYIRLREFLGLHPKCGCQQREQSLNTLGARLQAKMVGIGQRVAVPVKKLLSVVKRN